MSYVVLKLSGLVIQELFFAYIKPDFPLFTTM